MNQEEVNKRTVRKKTTSAGKTGRLSGKAATRNVVGIRKTAKEVQNVIPLGNGWVVKSSKSAKYFAITDSKTEAITIARTLAQTKGTGLVVHGKSGDIELAESF